MFSFPIPILSNFYLQFGCEKPEQAEHSFSSQSRIIKKGNLMRLSL